MSCQCAIRPDDGHSRGRVDPGEALSLHVQKDHGADAVRIGGMALAVRVLGRQASSIGQTDAASIPLPEFCERIFSFASACPWDGKLEWDPCGMNRRAASSSCMALRAV